MEENRLFRYFIFTLTTIVAVFGIYIFSSYLSLQQKCDDSIMNDNPFVYKYSSQNVTPSKKIIITAKGTTAKICYEKRTENFWTALFINKKIEKTYKIQDDKISVLSNIVDNAALTEQNVDKKLVTDNTQYISVNTEKTKISGYTTDTSDKVIIGGVLGFIDKMQSLIPDYKDIIKD